MLTRPKDPVPQEERVGVVYKILYRDCTKTYVGQSGHTLAMKPERTPESGPQWRRECLGYSRACLERATLHGLVSSGGGGLGTVPVPQIAVGVVVHSQRAEPHE